ncbi:MAG TPA: rhomboid family intramembrane serine protease [Gammaproteobacteria bacterium]|nr:rhomboid family intramembrane serine protease [Gammaproteobacteria bacterium]
MNNQIPSGLSAFVFKMKALYFPILWVTLLTIFGYTFLNWLLNIHLVLLHLKEEVFKFYIPVVLPWVPILFFLRRRIYLLNMKWKDAHDAWYLALWVMMLGPLMLLQDYVIKASFDLVGARSIAEVSAHRNEKYFQIGEFEIKKNQCVSHATARASGKHNENLNFYLYIACPFVGEDLVWYGARYQQGISNRGELEEKDRQYRRFIDDSTKKFEKLDLHQVSYFQRQEYSDDLDGYLKAVARNLDSAVEGEPIILIPEHEAFADRLGNSLAWAVVIYVAVALPLFFVVTLRGLKVDEYRNFISRKSRRDIWGGLSFLNPFGTYKASAVIFWLNAVVFVAMVVSGINPMSPTATELLEFGANNREAVMHGEIWRLVVSVFMHAGIAHLVFNMCALMMAALFLEPVLGWRKMAALYLFYGVAASMASIYWKEGISVGASGAILGLYGTMLSFCLGKIYPRGERDTVLVLVSLSAGISILLGFFIGADNAAHIGGFIVGIFAGLVLLVLGGLPANERIRRRNII